MTHIVLTMGAAFLLGFGIAIALHYFFRRARLLRAFTIAAMPLMALLMVFLAFTRFDPESDEWIWLGVGMFQFLPWYLAWLAGWGAEKLRRVVLVRSVD
ncbi:MAG: hypothetical protein SXU28_13635 [Pseudomonadota bacterium]|nr:hypothetical protein [Pseudomonadota bacterium]